MYQNTEFNFQFAYPKTSTLVSEEKSANDQSKRLLSLGLADPSLRSAQGEKDDERYLRVEVWLPDASYVQTLCNPQTSNSEKRVSQQTFAGQVANVFEYEDEFQRIHQDVCIGKADKIYLFQTSVSQKYGNQERVKSLFQQILQSLKFI